MGTDPLDRRPQQLCNAHSSPGHVEHYAKCRSALNSLNKAAGRRRGGYNGLALLTLRRCPTGKRRGETAFTVRLTRDRLQQWDAPPESTSWERGRGPRPALHKGGLLAGRRGREAEGFLEWHHLAHSLASWT